MKHLTKGALASLLLLGVFTFTSCSDNDSELPQIENKTELIGSKGMASRGFSITTDDIGALHNAAPSSHLLPEREPIFKDIIDDLEFSDLFGGPGTKVKYKANKKFRIDLQGYTARKEANIQVQYK